MTTRIEIKPFDELTRLELYDLMVLRNRVFVVEQEITEEAEIDGRDPNAHHVLLWRDDEIVGTTRIFMDKEPVKVGRVAVDRQHRRAGLGTKMMEAVVEFLDDRSASLHAQSYLEKWYAELGWRRRGKEFEEAGISHVRMDWP